MFTGSSLHAVCMELCPVLGMLFSDSECCSAGCCAHAFAPLVYNRSVPCVVDMITSIWLCNFNKFIADNSGQCQIVPCQLDH